MSRQFAPAQRPRVPSTSDNPYLGTTSSLPLGHSYVKPKEVNYHLKCTGSIRGAPCPLEQDACFTDEAFTEHSYYDFYDDHGYQTSPNRAKEDSSYSDDDSGSTKLPCYDYDNYSSSRRHSRNNYSERSIGRPIPQIVKKDSRRVYPNDNEHIQRCVEAVPQIIPARGQISRTSDRPSSSHSSGVPSAMVHGCGGKCQTFESVCYYFLQVAFAMGILIGISLGVAGWVLRKSAARNLQVLLYIGAMLSIVCALLLSIQCSARNSARLRQKSLRNAKRAPIPMEFIPIRAPVPVHHQQPLVDNSTLQRGIPVTLVQMPTRPLPELHLQRSTIERHQHVVDQQGVPWWRRKDLH
ncbi:PREDICTED: uncharacterized protein LOC108565455 [Nicrophorus vespilloides]|uniref:Uncharacterized protein LOC108565455 n=1 Tax=Nicrophorus vespilloides TaxID=110193 RepID=A0ABM1N0S3_NICVS|nr:PREDICTED: uncharacterized protein LOC108565455 [Nicrophorus vespilloides]XP_017780421.1 PREDICTED: uncharacterized protein LOC108565455 [Nicrophorus vespilloides]XP_017780423.1 PREDICTED: uncharacterized protein LOC108565455 [Nicrophorus vespilloides]XP_017780424.1 PREDICTED: uncharacterized protein LOC108565455 [Nicrophorus vespilloides]